MSNFRRTAGMVLGGIFIFCASACSPADDGAFTNTEAATYPKEAALQYDFTATVRQGTDNGLALHGTMVLVQTTDTTHADGLMVVPAAGSKPEMDIDVDASLSAGNIALTFKMPDSTVVNGVGPFGATIGTGTSTVQGTLTGPAADDKGDWAGVSQALASKSIMVPYGLQETHNYKQQHGDLVLCVCTKACAPDLPESGAITVFRAHATEDTKDLLRAQAGCRNNGVFTSATCTPSTIAGQPYQLTVACQQ